jgi:hypothetical protein
MGARALCWYGGRFCLWDLSGINSIVLMMKERPAKWIFKVNHIYVFRISILLLHFVGISFIIILKMRGPSCIIILPQQAKLTNTYKNIRLKLLNAFHWSFFHHNSKMHGPSRKKVLFLVCILCNFTFFFFKFCNYYSCFLYQLFTSQN